MNLKNTKDLHAKRMASEWYSSGRSPLYALSSSGAIVPGVMEEVQGLIDEIKGEKNRFPEDKTNIDELTELLLYIKTRRYNGNTGIQPHWPDLHW
jgi:hypothetical protein